MTDLGIAPLTGARLAGLPSLVGAGPHLDVTGMTFSVPGKTIVADASFRVPTGALTALIGPNGAGKSTLLRMMAGALPPDDPRSARVRLGGEDLLAIGRRARARTVALLEQQPVTEFSVTVRQTVALGRIPHGRWWWPGDDADQVVDEAMSRVGVADWADRPLATLSGGEQRRVHLARALAQQPRMLLLDEPTNHLDIAAQLELFELLHTLTGRDGLTVVVALHDLSAAAAHCAHAIVMDRGRVVTHGPVRESLDPALIQQVYGVGVDLLTHPRTGKPVVTFSRLADDSGSGPEFDRTPRTPRADRV